MGMSKPTVLLKWVRQVWAWYQFLAHCDTLRTHAAVSWVPHGYIVVKLSLFFNVLYYFFDLFFSFTTSHCDGTKYGSVSRAHSLSLPTQVSSTD